MARRDKFEALHARNRIKYEKEIKALFREVCRECGMSVNQLEYIVKNAGENADFARIPAVRKVLDKLQRKLAERLEKTVVDGVKAEWKLANDKYDALVGTMAAGDLLERMSEAQRARTFARNMEALEAFLQRKEEGLGLSQRVWQYSGQMRDAMEVALELGISEGQSAAEIARELQQYLVYPDKLFRRVRDEETGELKLSKPASLFHPGQGVYRSSYKNALRLALNETNIAYRKSDSIRRQGLSFVVGIEVHLSNNHNCKGIPEGEFFDICDILQGKYPPDFEFVGWHPNCRCWTSTIMQTDEEFFRDSDGVYRGSVNEVKDVPPQFRKWLEENQERIDRAEAAGKLPYFLRDNEWAWKEDAERPNERKVNQTRIKAEERHAARTEEQVKAIKDRWEQRKRAQRNAERTLRLVDSVPGMREYLGDRVSTSLNIVTGEKQFEGDYKKLEVAARIVRNEMRILRDDLDVLDKPWEVLKAHGVEKTLEAESSIRKKLSQWESQPLDYQLKKLKFEAQWLEDNKKGVISTWEVARDAYLKAAREVEWKIEWEPLQNELKALAKNPYADKDMIAEVRSYIGKDKDEAEYALSHLKQDIERAELRAEYEGYLNSAPNALNQVLRKAVEDAFDGGDLVEIRSYIAAAKAAVTIYQDLINKAAVLLSLLNDEGVKAKLQESVAHDNIANLGDTIALAERAYQFQVDLEDAKSLLSAGRYILTKLDKGYVEDLENAMTPKDYDSSEVVRLRLALSRCRDVLQRWNDAVAKFRDEYENYQTTSKAYNDLVREAWAAIRDIDKKGLEEALAKLQDKKDQLEKDKAYWAGVAAEWDKMKSDVFTIRAEINKDLSGFLHKDGGKELVSLIADFEVNEGGSKKLREGRKTYAAIVAKAKELGIDITPSSSVTFAEECFTKERKDTAVWDTEEAAADAGRKHGQLADDTLFPRASQVWKDAIARETRTKELISEYESGKISEAEFEKTLKQEGLEVYKYTYRGTTIYMTEREAVFEYTSHFCDVNEPLQGRPYLNQQNKDRFYAKVNAVTNIIGSSQTPKDMWFQRGDTNMDVIFSRLRFAGAQFDTALEAISRISGDTIDDDVVSKLQSLVGLTMQEGGFMSMGSAKNRGFTESYSKRVILNIYAPAGTRALYTEHFSDFGNGRMSANWDGEHCVTHFSKEFETLAQRGTKMRITKIEKGTVTISGSAIDIIYIDVEIVGQEVKDLSYVDVTKIGR